MESRRSGRVARFPRPCDGAASLDQDTRLTRSVVIVLVFAAGIAISILGTYAATRPASVGTRLRRRFKRVPADANVALIGALTAVFGIFVTAAGVIAEIWWLQGVPVL